MTDAPHAGRRRSPSGAGRSTPQPLGGGITNHNFLVEDGGRRYFVRIGDDIPVHHVLRCIELAASARRPRRRHLARGGPRRARRLVFDYVDGRTLRRPRTSASRPCSRASCRWSAAPIARSRSTSAARRSIFWVFQVLRDYARAARRTEALIGSRGAARLLAAAERLEAAVGPVELVFGHNDLLAANLIDDGSRLWLVDWEYAGFNSPLFDLGGLASNNELPPAQQELAARGLFRAPATDDLRRRYAAMNAPRSCARRCGAWSPSSTSAIDFDFQAYTAENLARFGRALAAFDEMDR